MLLNFLTTSSSYDEFLLQAKILLQAFSSPMTKQTIWLTLPPTAAWCPNPNPLQFQNTRTGWMPVPSAVVSGMSTEILVTGLLFLFLTGFFRTWSGIQLGFFTNSIHCHLAIKIAQTTNKQTNQWALDHSDAHWNHWKANDHKHKANHHVAVKCVWISFSNLNTTFHIWLSDSLIFEWQIPNCDGTTSKKGWYISLMRPQFSSLLWFCLCDPICFCDPVSHMRPNFGNAALILL